MQHVDYLGRRLIHPRARIVEQQRHLTHLSARLRRCAADAVRRTELYLAALRHRLAATAPDVVGLEAQRQHLAHRLASSIERGLEQHSAVLSRLAAHLNALGPQSVLERGYSIVAHGDGRIIRDAEQLAAGDDVQITLARGGALARVTRTRS